MRSSCLEHLYYLLFFSAFRVSELVSVNRSSHANLFSDVKLCPDYFKLLIGDQRQINLAGVVVLGLTIYWMTITALGGVFIIL